jgi:hypothetical protein
MAGLSMMTINWHDPAERLALVERVGVEEYNRQHAEHMRRSVVATVNGYKIRRTVSQRFGVIFMVDGLNKGHGTLEGASAIARAAKP